jgi:hypothetical protein
MQKITLWMDVSRFCFASVWFVVGDAGRMCSPFSSSSRRVDLVLPEMCCWSWLDGWIPLGFFLYVALVLCCCCPARFFLPCDPDFTQGNKLGIVVVGVEVGRGREIVGWGGRCIYSLYITGENKGRRVGWSAVESE